MRKKIYTEKEVEAIQAPIRWTKPGWVCYVREPDGSFVPVVPYPEKRPKARKS